MLQVHRGDLILKEDVGKEVLVSSGMGSGSFVVTEGMEGHRFGEFLVTKSIGSKIHVKRKKRKKK